MAIMGGLEAGFVFAIRDPYESGSQSASRGLTFFGILASVLIALALFPQYWEIYKHKEVVGVSITFILVDWLGGE
jgi:hypothetical protein